LVQHFHGIDFFWLAVDANGCVGCFSLGMSGPVPRLLSEDQLDEHEPRLERWVQSTGRAFEPDGGKALWRDAAATGVFAFDHDDSKGEYRIVAKPQSPVAHHEAPPPIREVLGLWLPTADFTTKVVTHEQVAAARLI
jgi:hypothetical protein